MKDLLKGLGLMALLLGVFLFSLNQVLILSFGHGIIL